MDVKEEPPERNVSCVDSKNQALPVDNTAETAVKIKVEEIFPCETAGCNINEPSEDIEQEHKLPCLLVKILQEQESEAPNLHIEQIAWILSKRYKYFYTIPPYMIVEMVKDLIETEPFVKGFTIILNEDDHCVLLSCDTDDASLEYVRYEIKMEYDDNEMNVRADPPMSDTDNGTPGEVKYEGSFDIESGKMITGNLLFLLTFK